MSNVYNHVCIALEEEFKERSLFRRVPPGACVCLADDGDLLLIGKPTNLTKEDLHDIVFADIMGLADNITDHDLRQDCTGNFILR